MSFALRPGGAPYDASLFTGITFDAESLGEQTSVDVTMVDANGSHDKQINLSAAWTTYTVNFSDLASFDSTTLEDVGFSLAANTSGATDFRIDNIRFIWAN
jgi:hypothetical protein